MLQFNYDALVPLSCESHPAVRGDESLQTFY